jgi:uncharacterized protein YbjQ (UPF0145 family)
MPFSTDDFDAWQQAHNPKPSHGDAPFAPPQNMPEVDMTGMPTFARLRLQEHVKKPKCSFTSNLSLNEFLLSRKMEYYPVAQVQGASVYHVGWQWMPSTYFGSASELTVLTNAHTDAWQLAIRRLEQQAEVAGAHTVIGVEHKHRGFDSSFTSTDSTPTQPTVIEVSLAGTAVRYRGGFGEGRPMVSTLTGQEFLTLRTAGFYPAGIVYGCCVFYQPSYWSWVTGSASTVAWGTQWQNQEMTDFTNGLIQARRYAVERMYDNAQMFGAHGILDVEIHSSMREIERDVNDRKQTGIVITFEAHGTAIMELESDRYPTVEPIVSLADTTV